MAERSNPSRATTRRRSSADVKAATDVSIASDAVNAEARRNSLDGGVPTPTAVAAALASAAIKLPAPAAAAAAVMPIRDR